MEKCFIFLVQKPETKVKVAQLGAVKVNLEKVKSRALLVPEVTLKIAQQTKVEVTQESPVSEQVEGQGQSGAAGRQVSRFLGAKGGGVAPQNQSEAVLKATAVRSPLQRR